MSNYYETLCINPAASDDDIKQAYRRLSMRWHPDRNPDNIPEATRRFKEVGEAYRILKDQSSREAYDRLLRTTEEAPEPTPSPSPSKPPNGSTGGGDRPPPAAADSRPFLERMVALAAELDMHGMSNNSVIQTLVAHGCTDEQARLIALLFAPEPPPAPPVSPSPPNSPRSPTSSANPKKREAVVLWVTGASIFGIISLLNAGRSPTAPVSAPIIVAQKPAAPAAATPAPVQDVISQLIPDYNAATAEGTFQFSALPNLAQDKPDDWVGRPLRAQLLGMQDLDASYRMYYFLFTPVTEVGKSFDCHACAPVVGGFMSRRKASGETVVLPMDGFARIGGWGTYQLDGGKAGVVSIAPGKKALVFSSGGGNQGQFSTYDILVGIEKSGFHLRGGFITGGTATGSSLCAGKPEDACENFKVTYRFGPENENGFYVLKSTVKGVRFNENQQGVPMDETRTVAFDGKQYPEPYQNGKL